VDIFLKEKLLIKRNSLGAGEISFYFKGDNYYKLYICKLML